MSQVDEEALNKQAKKIKEIFSKPSSLQEARKLWTEAQPKSMRDALEKYPTPTLREAMEAWSK